MQIPYMKPAEAAAALNVTIGTLRRWEAQGRITTFRSAGGVRMYPVSEIERVRSLTAEDFLKPVTDADAEGFGAEPTTLANCLQQFAAKEAAEKELAAVSSTFTLGGGAFADPFAGLGGDSGEA